MGDVVSFDAGIKIKTNREGGLQAQQEKQNEKEFLVKSYIALVGKEDDKGLERLNE